MPDYNPTRSAGQPSTALSPSDFKSEPFAKLPIFILSDPDLTPTDKLCYAALLDYQGGNGKAWPSQRKLAKRLGCKHTSGIIRSLARLEARGLIEVERAGTGKHNTYRVKSAPQMAPVHKVDQSTNDTTSAPQMAPQAVSFVDTIQTHPTHLINSGDEVFWEQAKRHMRTGVLDKDTFKTAWLEWVAYLKERRKTPVTATIRAQIDQLEEMGTTLAIDTIANSIRCGYTALVKPARKPGDPPRIMPKDEWVEQGRGMAFG